MPDGKPDLSGNWMRADREPLPSELAGLFSGPRDPAGDVAVELFVPTFPPDPKSPPLGAFWDIGTNIPDGLPLTPWAAALKKERMAADMKDNPDANCMPMGITQFHMQPQPRKIVQTPKLIVILYESNYGQRYIYMDGRPLPPQGEPQPWCTATRSDAGKEIRWSLKRTIFAAQKKARTTDGSTCVERPTAVRRSSWSASAARCSASWRST